MCMLQVGSASHRPPLTTTRLMRAHIPRASLTLVPCISPACLTHPRASFARARCVLDTDNSNQLDLSELSHFLKRGAIEHTAPKFGTATRSAAGNA